jgi:hypothetical protein
VPSPIFRFLITVAFIVATFIALRWLEVNLTVLLGNRLTLMMDETVSGLR